MFPISQERKEVNPMEMNKEPFVIRVTLEDGDPRICDYCSAYLVNEEGIAEEECHSTDFGLMCNIASVT